MSNQEITGYLPSDADIQKFQRLMKSVQSYSYLNKADEFYEKIERLATRTKDYTHPVIDRDDPDRVSGAKYECMQIREEEISADEKGDKYNSIKNRGVIKSGIILKRFDIDPSAPHIIGDVYDSNTRVIKARAVEKDNPKRAKLILKQAFITDRELCEWLLFHADFFQNGANDHLPVANASDADIKAAIHRRVAQAPKTVKDTPEFKKELKRIMAAMCSHRPKSTIDKWVNSEYNSRAANNNGVHRYHDKHDRQRSIRTALEHTLGVSADGWKEDSNGKIGLDHEDLKVYSVSSAKGALEKACGAEDYRTGMNKDNDRKSVCIGHISGGTTADSITKAQNAFFAKINIMSTTKTRRACFDDVFVLGQEHSVDLGDLLNETQVATKVKELKAAPQTPQLKVVGAK